MPEESKAKKLAAARRKVKYVGLERMTRHSSLVLTRIYCFDFV